MDSQRAHLAFRENRGQEHRRADAEVRQVFKVGGLHACIIDIGSVLRVQVAQSDPALHYSHGAVQARHGWVVDFNIGPAAGTSYANPWFVELTCQTLPRTGDDRDCNRLILRQRLACLVASCQW